MFRESFILIICILIGVTAFTLLKGFNDRVREERDTLNAEFREIEGQIDSIRSVKLYFENPSKISLLDAGMEKGSVLFGLNSIKDLEIKRNELKDLAFQNRQKIRELPFPRDVLNSMYLISGIVLLVLYPIRFLILLYRRGELQRIILKVKNNSKGARYSLLLLVVVLILTNPTQSRFSNYVEAKYDVSSYNGGREVNLFVASIFIVHIGSKSHTYLGVLGNFFELNSESRIRGSRRPRGY